MMRNVHTGLIYFIGSSIDAPIFSICTHANAKICQWTLENCNILKQNHNHDLEVSYAAVKIQGFILTFPNVRF